MRVQSPSHPEPAVETRNGRRHSTSSILVVVLVAALVLAAAAGAWLLLRGDDGDFDASGPTVSVLSAGAAGDGVTDDTDALQAAFDAARPGETVELPKGRTFAHGDVLSLRSPGVRVTGGGTLLATDEQRSSLVLAADDVVLEDVTLQVEKTTKRWDAYEQQRLRLDGHSGIVVRDVRVEGSAAAGVYVGGGTSDFLLEDVQVNGTRADGIHVTQGAHDGRVVSPVVENVGDDGVAVVSYAQDGEPCARIEIESPLVDGSSGGRGISVVGGAEITFRDIDVSDTYAAGIYIAAEGSFDTTGVNGVLVEGGSVTGANTGDDIDHGAVLIYNGTDDEKVQNIKIVDVALSGTRESASRWVGLIADSAGTITDVLLSDVSIDGPGPAKSFVVDAAGATYRTEGWARDGRDLPARESR